MKNMPLIIRHRDRATEAAIAAQLQHYSITSMVLADFARELECELAEVNAALDAAGCPTGNEHAVYDAVERIAGLQKTRDYAWRQLDAERAAREATEKERAK